MREQQDIQERFVGELERGLMASQVFGQPRTGDELRRRRITRGTLAACTMSVIAIAGVALGVEAVQHAGSSQPQVAASPTVLPTQPSLTCEIVEFSGFATGDVTYPSPHAAVRVYIPAEIPEERLVDRSESGLHVVDVLGDDGAPATTFQLAHFKAGWVVSGMTGCMP